MKGDLNVVKIIRCIIFKGITRMAGREKNQQHNSKKGSKRKKPREKRSVSQKKDSL